ncbi:hypothetical protein ACCS33_21300 [Rhizobium ruizarguesonis]
MINQLPDACAAEVRAIAGGKRSKDSLRRVLNLFKDLEQPQHHVLVQAGHDEARRSRDRFGQPKERPEVGIMQNARIAFARLLRELALDGVDGPDAPRSPRTADYGSRR